MMAAELTQTEIDNQIDAAIARSSEQISEPKACEVIYNRESRKIVIHFDNAAILIMRMIITILGI